VDAPEEGKCNMLGKFIYVNFSLVYFYKYLLWSYFFFFFFLEGLWIVVWSSCSQVEPGMLSNLHSSMNFGLLCLNEKLCLLSISA
jgi:hypothetical protein